LKKEGIIFNTNANVGVDIKVKGLQKEFDAICLSGGSTVARDLKIEGRQLKGIHLAMDYLIQSNRRVSGIKINSEELIDAKDKKVVVIGGGDTGADCVGTAYRQGASCVIQIEILPKPSPCRSGEYPWPQYPLLLKNSTSHEEGGQRLWAVSTKKFLGENGQLKKIFCVRVEFEKDLEGCPLIKEIPGSEFEIDADLVVLALGFLHPEKKGIIEELNLRLDARGNVRTDGNFMTSYRGLFCSGDMRRGQSLIVWAIAEGRCAADYIDNYLMGESTLAML
jgi:glutamate synthase (NADPH/NADH) small chain